MNEFRADLSIQSPDHPAFSAHATVTFQEKDKLVWYLTFGNKSYAAIRHVGDQAILDNSAVVRLYLRDLIDDCARSFSSILHC